VASIKRASVAPSVRLASRSGADTRFVKVVEALQGEPGVSYGGNGSQRFGHTALKAGGKIFAMVSSAGNFVVKLPAHRVAELEQAGVGMRFQAGKSRPMKEWFALNPLSKKPWLPLAKEALRFVAGEGAS
jgi:hypothetical protein